MRHTFYPTYEEWKPGKGAEDFAAILLFILPMRNGNMERRGLLERLELTFYPTYEEWKPW